MALYEGVGVLGDALSHVLCTDNGTDLVRLNEE